MPVWCENSGHQQARVTEKVGNVILFIPKSVSWVLKPIETKYSPFERAGQKSLFDVQNLHTAIFLYRGDITIPIYTRLIRQERERRKRRLNSPAEYKIRIFQFETFLPTL